MKKKRNLRPRFAPMGRGVVIIRNVSDSFNHNSDEAIMRLLAVVEAQQRQISALTDTLLLLKGEICRLGGDVDGGNKGK